MAAEALKILIVTKFGESKKPHIWSTRHLFENSMSL